MATYKKRGNKGKKSNQANLTDHSATAEVFKTLDETASKSEQWVEKNQRPIFIGLISIAVVILGYLAYNKYILEPNEIEAADELAFPKKYFEEAQSSSVAVDSLYNLSLNGADGKYGLIDIAEQYGNTKAGNLAKYMSGIAYLNIGDYENAIENVSRNGADAMDVRLGDVGALYLEKFDVVLANITRNILVRDMSEYTGHMAEQGILLISGILTEDVQYILDEAYRCGLDHLNTQEDSNWICLTFLNHRNSDQ